MGDECHNRNRAASALLIKALAPHVAALDRPASERERILAFAAGNEHFFLNIGMAACKAATDAAHGVPGSSVVTTMARNGTDFGIRVSGLGARWFTAPAATPVGLFFPGFGPDDSQPGHRRQRHHRDRGARRLRHGRRARHRPVRRRHPGRRPAHHAAHVRDHLRRAPGLSPAGARLPRHADGHRRPTGHGRPGSCRRSTPALPIGSPASARSAPARPAAAGLLLRCPARAGRERRAHARLRIGIDTGGTFTDVVAVNEATGDMITTKTPSTPHDPSLGVLEGIRKVLALAGRAAVAVGLPRDHGGHQRAAGRAVPGPGPRDDRGLPSRAGDRAAVRAPRVRQLVLLGEARAHRAAPPRARGARAHDLPGRGAAPSRRGGRGRGGPLAPAARACARSACPSSTPTPTPRTSGGCARSCCASTPTPTCRSPRRCSPSTASTSAPSPRSSTPS